MRPNHLFYFFLILFSGCKYSNNRYYSVTDFGARGDRVTLCTGAIQRSIDVAAKNGGGTVIIPQGQFLTGSLFLKSNVTLDIQNGAELLGSGNLEDYIPAEDSILKSWGTDRHLIVIGGAENVTLKGEGTINGQGWNFWEKPENPYQWIKAKERPGPMIMVSHSRNVAIRDLNLINPPGWTGNIHASEKVYIKGVVIDNNLRSPNSDGFDISGSREVIISDCNISTCDDAIVLNSVPGDVKNVTISNCIIRTLCAAIKIGWPGDKNNISDISVSNCNIWGSNRGIAIYQSYGITENISVSNIVFESNTPIIFTRPIHIDLRRQRDTTRQIGIVRNIGISNFTARTQGRILITAEEGGFIENLSLSDIKLQYQYFEDPGVYAKNPASDQSSNKSPEARVAKAALAAENVKNLWINNLQIIWPGDKVPDDWKIDNKIENGSFTNIYHPDYSTARPVEFSVFWGKGIEKAYINAPLSEPSAKGVEKYQIRNSDGVFTN